MTAIMKSVSPRICEKVANGDCTILVSKTAPKCEVPFKAYIYETKENKMRYLNDRFNSFFSGKSCYTDMGKVIGEFVCDKVFLLHPYTYDGGNADLRHRKLIQTFEGSSKENEILAATCLTQDEMFDYIGAGNYGYGWHISDLKRYGKPKELSEFFTPMGKRPSYMVERPPQSWQYVEEI